MSATFDEDATTGSISTTTIAGDVDIVLTCDFQEMVMSTLVQYIPIPTPDYLRLGKVQVTNFNSEARDNFWHIILSVRSEEQPRFGIISGKNNGAPVRPHISINLTSTLLRLFFILHA